MSAAPADPDLLLRAQGIEVRFGEGPTAVDALRGVDVDLHATEILMLMGPSGSGKTTLIQVLGGLLQPTAGSVTVGGQAIEALDSRALDALRLARFGYVFQGYNLFPTLKAWENVAVALDLKGVAGPATERRARELLEQVGMADRADHYPSKLSGGQKQRVAIARALAGEPAILLADEPTAALDSENGAKVMALLHALAHRNGCAIVIVTHDSRIMRFADRVLYLEDGHMAAPPAPSPPLPETRP